MDSSSVYRAARFSGPGYAFGFLAVGLFLWRALYASRCELFPEEAYYWNYAQHLDLGYLDHPPMVAWLIWLGTTVFGHGEWGVRVGALGCSLATSFFAFRLTETVGGDRRAAWTAAGLAQCLPYFFLAGWLMTPDAPLTACWAATLYFLARVFLAGDGRALLGAGAWLGLGMLSKYTVVLLVPATGLFLVLVPDARRWFRRGGPYAAAALAAAIFSPVMFWNAQHHWASFAFQSVARVRAVRRFSTPELLASILLVLTPLGIWLAWRVLAGKKSAQRREVLFARVYVLVPLAVFVVFSLTHRVKLNWTGPLWLAAVPALAVGWTGRSARVTVAVLCVGYLAALQYLATGLPGVRYYRRTELLPVGWKPLADEVAARQRELQAAGAPGPVYIVGMDRDFIASEIAFYHPDQSRAVQETTGAHLFESDSLMYAFWFPPPQENGATMLLVSFDKKMLQAPRVARHSVAQEAIEAHSLAVGGKPVRTYYTRVVTGYHSERSTAARPVHRAIFWTPVAARMYRTSATGTRFNSANASANERSCSRRCKSWRLVIVLPIASSNWRWLSVAAFSDPAVPSVPSVRFARKIAAALNGRKSWYVCGTSAKSPSSRSVSKSSCPTAPRRTRARPVSVTWYV